MLCFPMVVRRGSLSVVSSRWHPPRREMLPAESGTPRGTAAAKNHRKETRRLRKRRRTGKYLLLRWNQGAVVAQAAGVAPV